MPNPLHLPEPPRPRMVVSSDGLNLATYEWGDPEAPTLVAIHGFASSAIMNYFRTGWTRDLTRAGFRVIGIDQRGHGSSDKPHDASYYRVERLVEDVLNVLDAFVLNDVQLVGYSLGARIGWQVALDSPDRVSRAVLGGIPDGQPLTRFRSDQVLAYLERGEPVTDSITSAYLSMVTAVSGNDLRALVALVDGMRGGLQPDPTNPPRQPILFATGSDDAIIERSRALAMATPHGSFYEIPNRHHFNAPTSKHFRARAVEFVRAGLQQED